MSDRVLGALLAGGRSSRFGSDKAMALLHGRRLLDRAFDQLAAHSDRVVVCGRPYPGFPFLPDRPRPDMGPLGGLNAALHHGAEHGFAAVLTSGCDVPIFPGALAEALIGGGPAILSAMPLIGYWPVGLADDLDRFLVTTGRHAIRGWAEFVDARRIDLPGLSLPNINRPEDLLALEASWREP